MSLQIDNRDARRLALVTAGLLRPGLVGLPNSVSGGKKRATDAAHRLIDHFGYLQLDTVSVAGARSHSIVLHSRWPKMDPTVAENLLVPKTPLFEYWGHEACWMPLDLYSSFEFRREDFQTRHWTQKVLQEHPGLADELLLRIKNDGPVRSLDLDGTGKGGWWGHKPAKGVAVALWSSGKLAIRERSNFQRTFDLVERVIPKSVAAKPLPLEVALPGLLYRALAGHGWAQTGTLANTWRLRNLRKEIDAALSELVDQGKVLPCSLAPPKDASGGRSPRSLRPPRPTPGWIRSDHFELLTSIRRLRIDPQDARLLSPFDPLIWDRQRTLRLFEFDYTIEIFKPKETRQFGYYCLPILAGEDLVGRMDLKADRKRGTLQVVSRHEEVRDSLGLTPAEVQAAGDIALARFGTALGLVIV